MSVTDKLLAIESALTNAAKEFFSENIKPIMRDAEEARKEEEDGDEFTYKIGVAFSIIQTPRGEFVKAAGSWAVKHKAETPETRVSYEGDMIGDIREVPGR